MAGKQLKIFYKLEQLERHIVENATRYRSMEKALYNTIDENVNTDSKCYNQLYRAYETMHKVVHDMTEDTMKLEDDINWIMYHLKYLQDLKPDVLAITLANLREILKDDYVEEADDK